MADTGREESRKLNITVSSGTGTGTIANIWALAKRVRVVPPNETVTYNLAINDGEGDYIVYRTALTGTFSEEMHLSLGIAMTVVVSSASADGTFKVKFDMH